MKCKQIWCYMEHGQKINKRWQEPNASQYKMVRPSSWDADHARKNSSGLQPSIGKTFITKRSESFICYQFKAKFQKKKKNLKYQQPLKYLKNSLFLSNNVLESTVYCIDK